MSIRIMAQVWDSSPFEGRALLVELALADFANDEGMCWPAVETLARKARCSESWVHQIIRQLKASGRLSVAEAGGRGRTNTYKLDPNAGEKGAFNAPFSEKGALDSAKRVHSTAPDPSIEPSFVVGDPRAGEIDAIAAAFAQYGNVTAGTAQAIEWAVKDYSADWVLKAVRQCSGANFEDHPPWRYVESTLERWAKQGGPDEPKEEVHGRTKTHRYGNGRRGGSVGSVDDPTGIADWDRYAAGDG